MKIFQAKIVGWSEGVGKESKRRWARAHLTYENENIQGLGVGSAFVPESLMSELAIGDSVSCCFAGNILNILEVD